MIFTEEILNTSVDGEEEKEETPAEEMPAEEGAEEMPEEKEEAVM